jgi:hypothetical protein
MKKKVTQGLLEYLLSRSGCTYLSDLHSREYLPSVQRALRWVKPGRYSLTEWNDAVQYIIGDNVTFLSCKQAARYLRNGGKAK